ncbi:MAG TPA: transporter substrate-binding domain-containing protein [Prolixibacteraceae bacterium]|nr:transporter substrate-binding domain-containing protein [Prolixibacteraceae bacterium]
MILKYRNVFLLILMLFLFSTCIEQTRSASVWENGRFEAPLRDLETIRKEGRLRVVVDYGSTSYYVYRGKPMGFKYSLLRELARDLNVELDIYVSNDLENTFRGLETGRYDVAAKNLTVTGERARRVDFTLPLEQTRQVLVQRKGPPGSREDSLLVHNVLALRNREIVVPRNSAFHERLKNLGEEIGEPLQMVVDSVSDTEQLVRQVAEGSISLTVCDEMMARVYRQHYPQLDFSMPVSFRQNVAWAVRKDARRLKEYLDGWLAEFMGTPRYRALYASYFRSNRNGQGVSAPLSSRGGRLSPYDDLIKQEAADAGWDWRLVAAIIHKESGFNPAAVSFAGASGLMQLMPETAESLGVEDIFDPVQNIRGGIALLSWLDKQFEREIPDREERLRFVLASYNVGLGHVKDAQRLALKYGKNPLLWEDHVDYFLLNKSEEKYFSDEVVRWGFANGRETFDFVRTVLGNYASLTSVASR